MGFEALLRWKSKTLGFVMPGEFIPLAEESGMIVPIGAWVIGEACRQIGHLERQLGRQFELSINLSPRQLLQSELPGIIEQALQENNRNPESLKMEITESVLMSDSVRNHKAIRRIRQLGVRIAIDDFGIGFSSLSYISRFPIDWIKIDRSFISDCTNDPASLAVVRAVIAMAHSLDIHVTAEGVETLDQLSAVTREDCDAVQGYCYSRPVPLSDLPKLIETLTKPQVAAI
jgi:EAL domain-containing protein (putative c-di-GMP-specific phosphodiesterase class I)